jgi:hypothetical protein
MNLLARHSRPLSHVIPAKAGISENAHVYCILRGMFKERFMRTRRFLKKNSRHLDEIPAFAGMTVRLLRKCRQYFHF